MTTLVVSSSSSTFYRLKTTSFPWLLVGGGSSFNGKKRMSVRFVSVGVLTDFLVIMALRDSEIGRAHV